ncbi:MAG TPA: DUF1801 domain-containing protein [Ignavibacteria bacterium]|nr:DUF1801 domain-containing protein [Ignavibacteria bacterium]
MKYHPFEDLKAASVYDNYPDPLRKKLMELRELIFETAGKTDGVGKIQETLKWGQPSYLTPETKSGSTIRIGVVKSDPDKYALYFHCQTNLIESFRNLFPKEHTYEKNRAIIFDTRQKLPRKSVSESIRMALTYHQKKS